MNWDNIKWVLLGIAIMVVILFVPWKSPVQAQVPSITLEWTAPGDDGMVGTASTYQMRWSATRPDTTSQSAMDSWWAAATVVAGLPTPAVSGTEQTMVVAPAGGFPAGQTYYFVIRAGDEVPNWSAYSNVASKPVLDVVPPARIIDLIVR